MKELVDKNVMSLAFFLSECLVLEELASWECISRNYINKLSNNDFFSYNLSAFVWGEKSKQALRPLLEILHSYARYISESCTILE